MAARICDAAATSMVAAATRKETRNVEGMRKFSGAGRRGCGAGNNPAIMGSPRPTDREAVVAVIRHAHGCFVHARPQRQIVEHVLHAKAKAIALPAVAENGGVDVTGRHLPVRARA